MLPPKIAVFSFWHGQGSGAERILEHLLTAATEDLRDSLIVVSPEKSGVFDTAKNCGYQTVSWPASAPSAFRNDVPAALRFLPSLQKLRPDLLHAWHARCFELTALMGGLLKIPVSGTLHDHPNAVGYSFLRRKLMSWGSHRMQGLVCVSQALTDACRQAGWTVPITTIRNGLPETPITERTTAQSDPLNIAFLGCAERWKGADFVLDMAAKMSPTRFRWNFYGPATHASATRVCEQKTPHEGVFFHGRKTPSEIYAKNDIVIHPSQRFDPFPTVLLEAARNGTPVVATATGGTSEIVSDEETGFLIGCTDPEMAIVRVEQLAADPDLRPRISANARLHFERNFRVERMLSQYRTFWSSNLGLGFHP